MCTCTYIYPEAIACTPVRRVLLGHDISKPFFLLLFPIVRRNTFVLKYVLYTFVGDSRVVRTTRLSPTKVYNTHKASYVILDARGWTYSCLLHSRSGFHWCFSFAPVFKWCCLTPLVSRVVISDTSDLFVFCSDSLMD